MDMSGGFRTGPCWERAPSEAIAGKAVVMPEEEIWGRVPDSSSVSFLIPSALMRPHRPTEPSC